MPCRSAIGLIILGEKMHFPWCCATLCLLEPCRHERPPGAKRCRTCNAAYFREYRKTRESIAVKTARKEGREDAFRLVRVTLLECGDSPLTGFTAAELIRKTGLD